MHGDDGWSCVCGGGGAIEHIGGRDTVTRLQQTNGVELKRTSQPMAEGWKKERQVSVCACVMSCKERKVDNRVSQVGKSWILSVFLTTFALSV